MCRYVAIIRQIFLSTLSLRRATENPLRQVVNRSISIHALLTESDVTPMVTPPSYKYFYPRSPYGERQQSSSYNAYLEEFLSTLSLRRATNPIRECQIVPIISIHALLTESDAACPFCENRIEKFLSTLSLRRATSAADSSSICSSNFYPRSPYGERRTSPKP